MPGPTEGIALLWRGGALQRVEVQGAEYRSMAPGDIGLEVQVAGEGCMGNMAPAACGMPVNGAWRCLCRTGAMRKV